MQGNWDRRAVTAMCRLARPQILLAIAGALALAGCNQTDPAKVSVAQPRGATVAFESIDGLPRTQFRTLVANLNDEAQTRRLAVISREQPSAYRVRGYLAAEVAQGDTTVSWVWDVFDGSEHRTLRIAGAEKAKNGNRDAWTVADDAMLRRIASASMDHLAAFLTSPAVAPGTPAPAPMPSAEPQIALGLDATTPESAGIFRIVRPQADPVAGKTAQAPAASTDDTDAAPVPPRRAEPAVSARETLTLAASSRH